MQHAKYALVLTVEQGKNKDRSDACDFWFIFEFLDNCILTMNFEAHKKFWSGHYEHFLFCCFLLSCTSHVMGRMLI